MLNQQQIRRACAILAAMLWTLAGATMAFALGVGDPTLGGASVLIGLGAAVPTGHLIVDYTARMSRTDLIAEVDQIVHAHRLMMTDTVLEVIARADAEAAADVHRLH